MADTTIVIPCYNEADRLDVETFIAHTLFDPPHRFLFVNDGSTDATLDVLRDLNAYDAERFEYLDLPQNGGKAEAVRRGVLAAMDRSPRYVGYWDADLATPLDEIEPFRRILEDRDDLAIVLGARIRMLGRSIHRKPHRHALGRVFATAASWTLGLGVYDTQCGAKLFRVNEAARRAFEQPFITGWIFDVELLARMLVAHGDELPALEEAIFEQPLMRWEDVGGSKVRPRDFFKAFFELVAIYRTYLRPAARRRWAEMPTPPIHQELREETISPVRQPTSRAPAPKRWTSIPDAPPV
jgi:glycosyltransferase involved in cell wall biosynthesis